MPWLGDACSLVDAYRAGQLSPVEALDDCLAAIDASTLNAFSFLDPDGARAAAASADVHLPFGGVPLGIKEADRVKGWPFTEASLIFKDRICATDDTTQVARMKAAGAVPVGLTTASEFGFVAYTSTKLNGTTRNPWDPTRTPGGSSGGSAAAVAGGLVPIATGGDGGGSIRIPASYCSLLGLKTSFGRIPRGPRTDIEPLTVTIGCLSRSVRDTARWLDVCNGYDTRDRFSLPRVEGWERNLGTHDLTGRKVAISPTMFGAAVVDTAIAERIVGAGEELAKQAGLDLVVLDHQLPDPGMVWGLAGLPTAVAEFGHLSPEERLLLTDELRMGIELGLEWYRINHAVDVERFRVDLNEAMAEVFDQVDFVIAATCPWEPHAAEGPTPHMVGNQMVSPFNAGALTIPCNISGYPAVSIPAGVDAAGHPIGLQICTRHHDEALLLDLALMAERERPWPLVAPGAPV